MADALPALGTRVVRVLRRRAAAAAGRVRRGRHVSRARPLAAPADERRAARALRGPRSRRGFRSVFVSLDAATDALYQAVRGVAALATVETRHRAAAPHRAAGAGDGAGDAAPDEFPRAAAAHRSREGDGRSTASRFSPPTCRPRPSAASRVRRASPAGSGARTADEVARVRRTSSSRRSTHHREDFESGFVAESPAKLRRLPQYYAALGGDGAVSARRRATRRGCRWCSRPTGRCGPASFTRRSATSAARRSRRSRDAQSARVPCDRSTSDSRSRRARGASVRSRPAGGTAPWHVVAARSSIRSGRSTASPRTTTARTPRTAILSAMRDRVRRDGRARSCPPARTSSISAADPARTPNISRVAAIASTAIDWSPAMVDAGRAPNPAVRARRARRRAASRAFTSSIASRRPTFDAVVLELRPAQLRARSRRPLCTGSPDACGRAACSSRR